MNPDYPYECKKTNRFTIRINNTIYVLKTDAQQIVIEKTIELIKMSKSEPLTALEIILLGLGYSVYITLQRDNVDFEL